MFTDQVLISHTDGSLSCRQMTAHEYVNEAGLYCSAMAKLNASPALLAQLPAIRSTMVLAGRIARQSDLDRTQALELIEARMRELMHAFQTTDVATTVGFRMQLREAQTNTGATVTDKRTGKQRKVNMSRAMKRINWKKERGLELTETERQTVLARVRNEIDREFGARDNNSTQLGSHDAYVTVDTSIDF